MATVQTADAAKKLQCNFVLGILDRINADSYGYDCYLYNDTELIKMVNYYYLLQSTCDLDIDCSSASFVKKLPIVNICDSREIFNCTLITIAEVVPESCDLYNIIQIT